MECFLSDTPRSLRHPQKPWLCQAVGDAREPQADVAHEVGDLKLHAGRITLSNVGTSGWRNKMEAEIDDYNGMEIDREKDGKHHF